MDIIDPHVLEEHFLEVCCSIHINHINTFVLSWLCGHDKANMVRRTSEVNDPLADVDVTDEAMSQVIYSSTVSCWFKCYASMILTFFSFWDIIGS